MPGAAEAEAELAAALAESTAALTRLDVAQWRPELAGALAALRRPDSATDLPPGFDPRARRLFARASVLDRVLALAGHAAPGGAINNYEAQQRDAALRPLDRACRRALVAACNAPLRPLSPRTSATPRPGGCSLTAAPQSDLVDQVATESMIRDGRYG